jgi:hypothetical protein
VTDRARFQCNSCGLVYTAGERERVWVTFDGLYCRACWASEPVAPQGRGRMVKHVTSDARAPSKPLVMARDARRSRRTAWFPADGADALAGTPAIVERNAESEECEAAPAAGEKT